MRHSLVRRVRSWSPRLGVFAVAAAGGLASSAVLASDHGDAALLQQIGRNDARLTDLHVFARGSNLVLAVSLNPGIPRSAASYQFAPDHTVEVLIDRNGEVSFDDPAALATYGGTVVRPKQIMEDVVFRVRFREDGSPVLHTRGLTPAARERVRLFTGLRDDPFIRGPRVGRNVAAIVIEVPLADVLGEQSTLLVWTTSKIEDMRGPLQDMAGRSLRSMMPENLAMNEMKPHQHEHRLGSPPDVIIYDTSRPAVFPNGRELADDVVDLVGDSRVLADDAPFPAENDVPFLTEFPYLAPPHPPVP